MVERPGQDSRAAQVLEPARGVGRARHAKQTGPADDLEPRPRQPGVRPVVQVGAAVVDNLDKLERYLFMAGDQKCVLQIKDLVGEGRL